MNRKILFIHNYKSPYRIKLFNEINKLIKIEVCYLQDQLSENRVWNLPEEEYKSYDVNFKTIGKLVLNNFINLKKLIKDYETVVIIDNIPNFLSNMFITLFAKQKKLIYWVEEYNYKNNWFYHENSG